MDDYLATEKYLERCKSLRTELCVTTARLRQAEKEQEDSLILRAKMRHVIDKRETLLKLKIKMAQ